MGGHGDGTDAPAHATRVTEGGERRWPIGLGGHRGDRADGPAAQRRSAPGHGGFCPASSGLLLVALVLGDPGRISRRSAGLRLFSICLVGVLAFDALCSTVRLVDELIQAGAITQSAEELLQAGGVVWISNNLAFALLYWELDGGGPAARLCASAPLPRSRPSRKSSVRVSHPRGGSRSSSTTCTWRSRTPPPSALPMSCRWQRWAKSAMAVQALISLTVLGLVVARAINVLS